MPPATQTAQDPSILTRLGYFYEDKEQGLKRSLQAYADYKAKRALAAEELQKQQLRVETQFSEGLRRELQKQLNDVTQVLSERAVRERSLHGTALTMSRQKTERITDEANALRTQLGLFDQERAKLGQLQQGYVQLGNEMKKAQAATGILRGGVGGGLGIERIVQGFTLGGLAQTFGVVAAAQNLPQLLKDIALGMGEAAVKTGEYAHNLDLISQKTGIAVPELQKLEFIGKTTGLSLDDVVIGARRLSAAIVGGEGGGEGLEEAGNRGAKVLKALHISTRDAATGGFRPMNEVVEDLAEVLAKAPDGMEKVRIVSELLGKTGLNWIPFLDQGKKGVSELSLIFEKFRPQVGGLTQDYRDYEFALAKSEAATKSAAATWTSSFLGMKSVWHDWMAEVKSAVPAVLPLLMPELFPRQREKGTAPKPQQAPPGFSQAAAIAAGLKDSNKAASEREAIERSRAKIVEARTVGERNLRIALLGTMMIEEEFLQLRIRENAQELQSLELQKESEERNQRQAILLTEQFDLNIRLDEALRKRAQTERELVDLQAPLQERMALGQRQLFNISGIPTFPPMPGGLPITGFQGRLEITEAQRAAGLISAERAIVELRSQQADVLSEIVLRQTALLAVTDTTSEGYKKQVKELNEMLELLGKITSEQKKASELTPLGNFLAGFKELTNIVGKFSAGLHRAFSEIAATIEASIAAFAQLRKLGGGEQAAPGAPVVGGSALGGLKKLFKDLFGGAGLSGMLAGIGALLGPIGAAIGGIVGLVSTVWDKIGFSWKGFLVGGPIGGLIWGSLNRKKVRAIAKEISNEIKKTIADVNSGAISIAQAIANLERQRQEVMTRLTGKKSGRERDALLAQIDQALTDLHAKARQILEQFSAKIGLLEVAEGARDAADAIRQMAETLKQAADAGASAEDQINFLNRSLDELRIKLGRELRDDEQETLDLLMQEIDLRKQRQDIIKQAADQELAVRQRLGLARQLTPAQTAAQEIRRIREQRDEQLASLDEQEEKLRAQLEGRAELFGFSLRELDAADARSRIIARQLEIERAITQEVIARITAIQAFYGDLLAGHIPALPPGILPPGFALPTGSTYNLPNATVNINIGNPGNLTPDEIADLVREGLAHLGNQAWHGIQP